MPCANRPRTVKSRCCCGTGSFCAKHGRYGRPSSGYAATNREEDSMVNHAPAGGGIRIIRKKIGD